MGRSSSRMSQSTDATKKIQELRLMCAIKTPYLSDGSIDLAAYDKHAEYLISNGVEALIIGGTTGEGHLFSWEEHLVLIAHTKAVFKDRVMVVGNTGSNHTGESIAATKKGFAVGMDCSLLINPYYGKTSATGMGMKVWSGNDDLCHQETHDCGAMGVISVTANVVPALMSQLVNGRNDELNTKLGPLFSWLFSEPNPIGLNTMLMMPDMAYPMFRPPYTPRDAAARAVGVELINAIGLENFPVGEKGLRAVDEAEFLFSTE